jgi:hypothetical protein
VSSEGLEPSIVCVPVRGCEVREDEEDELVTQELHQSQTNKKNKTKEKKRKGSRQN